MQIRTKLTLRFAILVAIIITLFSIFIYYFSANHREDQFYSRLKEKALTTAKLFSREVKEVDMSLLKVIDRNSMTTLPEERVLIYDLNNKLIYNSSERDSISSSDKPLARIRSNREIRYQDGAHEVLGILFEGKYDRFVVIASAYDRYGLSKLRFLRYILIIGFLITVGVTTVVGLVYSKQALKPISNIINEVDKITASNMGLKINEGNGSDEVAQLAIKFNQMLSRLGEAFEMQRAFVANASHELRTPLTAITGQLEVSLMNQKVNDESRKILKSLLEDIRHLNKLSNGLLDLAQTSFDISEVKLYGIRVDELIGQARAEVLKSNIDYVIGIEFEEIPEDEALMRITGNEQLLKIALINLFENGCKYSSNRTVMVKVRLKASALEMEIIDTGIGIPSKEMKHLYQPFFRASNSRSYRGHGIGLALTRKIIHIHKGEIHLYSKLNIGTTVILRFPR